MIISEIVDRYTMELTQRLECTQELYTNNYCEKSPDQVGFLGICGTKYPLRKGPNKIGRDPETCNIILNLNSVSRQHAVINILNSHDFMLMDLDSANKTKLSDKTLQAYIPHPLKNGDMVQFGQVFGVFRLLQEESDLPMTQAIDIPETPVSSRHVSKLNNIHATTIPESPDVSDKDDSFIAASQHKPKNVFKSPNNNFLKSSGKTISIKPVGTNKIDNVYWSSSKKSDSFSMQSNVSINIDDSITSPRISDANLSNQNIHDLETQMPFTNQNEPNDSIYNANTQVTEIPTFPNIYEMDTQLPTTENLPKVCKMQYQQELHLNLCAEVENKENDTNIFNATTQVLFDEKPKSPKNVPSKLSSSNVSDDIILFDEIDSQPMEDNFESQPLLLSPKLYDDRKFECEENNTESQDIQFAPQKRINRINSESSTDCEDINIDVIQKIPLKINNDGDSTDCEDEYVFKPNKNLIEYPNINDDVTDCGDNKNENNLVPFDKTVRNENFEDLPTQILEDPNIVNIADISTRNNNVNKAGITNCEEQAPIQIIDESKNNAIDSKNQETAFEDLCTQVILSEQPKNTCFEEALTQQIYSEEVVKFKVPFQSPVKKKKKHETHITSNKKTSIITIDDDADDKYYAATQELFNDLCSQRELSPEIISSKAKSKKKSLNDEHQQPMKNKITVNTHFPQESGENSDVEERINEFVSNLSVSQIQDIVGVQKLKKVPSDSSDTEATPKKINCLSVLETDLPNTQEIKTSISLIPNISDTESLSDPNESRNSEPNTLIKHKSKTKKLHKIKINLSDKFDPEAAPIRTSTRVKKPKSINYVDKQAIKENEQSKVTSRRVKGEESKSNTKSKDKNRSSSKKNDLLQYYEKDESYGLRKTKEKDIDKRHQAKIKEESYEKSLDRNTRSRFKQKVESNSSIKKSKSPEKDNHKSEPKNKDNKRNKKYNAEESKSTEKGKTKTGNEKNSKSTEKLDKTEIEVRRSKRNRTAKKSEELYNDVAKSKAKSPIIHEQNTVYSIVSLDSDADSPNRLKRPATCELEVPNAKKSRSGVSSTSLRATPARKPKAHYVLFTAFPCEEVKDKLESLGAVIVSDVMACTVVLTLQIKRTFKLLCALGLGKPIVGPNWVQACVDTRMIVDPWLYLMKDEPTEKRFKFNLQLSLTGKRDFLKGYNVSSTPSVMPGAAEMKLIVECSGGKWKSEGPNWICISASADRNLWAGLKRKGAIIVSTEFILGGVLRQKLDIQTNKLA